MFKKNTQHYIVEEFNMDIIFNMQSEQLFDFSLTKGNKLWAICPYCGFGRYIHKSVFSNSVRERKTYCSEHRHLPRTKYCFIGEFDDHKKMIIVNYRRQGMYLYEIGKKRLHCILSYCPHCGEERWKNVQSLRHDLNTKCMSCSKKYQEHPKKNNGIMITNGYREIHKDNLTPELRELAKKHLKIHRNYYYEHRLIALQKYGTKAIQPGIVVRHRDGDKLNNDPDNLRLGTQGDNVRDHMTDRKELQLLREQLRINGT